jgi:hypothetical protein
MNVIRRPTRAEMDPEAMASYVERHPALKAELLADRFAGRFCVACSGRGALFATPIWFVPCPRCLAARMRRLMESREDLPWWVEYLADQCERTVVSMEREERSALSVEFDPLLTCHRCGRLIPKDKARYVFPGGKGPGRPHCQECMERRAWDQD